MSALTSTRRHRDVVIPLALGTSILCLLALLWLALFPAVATSPDGLKGMMPQNNSMAYVAAVALISALFAQELPRPLRIALILLDTLTLVLTLSMTSWLAVIAATLTASMVIGLRRFSLRLRAAIGLLLAGVMATLGYLLVFVPVARAADRVVERLRGQGVTAQALRDWGIEPDLVPSGEQSAAGLLAAWLQAPDVDPAAALDAGLARAAAVVRRPGARSVLSRR